MSFSPFLHDSDSLKEKRKIQKMSTPKENMSGSRLYTKTALTPNESPVQKSVKTSLQFESPIPHVSGSIMKSNAERSCDKLVIFVDSKELSSGQQIVTMLKSKHKVHVVVASSTHCDYIVGRGTVVERKLMSEFGNVMKRQKLIARIQELFSHHDRVYLLIEQDRTKRNDIGSGRSNVHSDYYISTVCYLTQANVRILHSDTEVDSAAILQMLAEREGALKRSIEVNVAEQANNHKLRSLIQAYSAIPKISFISALYLCHNFKSFREVASSSVEKLIQKAHISTSAAAEVYSFFRRQFDLQMTPSK